MAAGLGFKDFVTGEVLTAADVDGYLMQGVWVFASAAARDAAVTSPQEGNFAYLKDTNVTTYYTGSAWANLDTTGMTNPMTTTGDTIYSSSGSTPARLGIGTANQVLTVNAGATAPEWKTLAAGGGKVLQVVQGTYSTATTIATNTYTDTGLSLSITPTSATSKILVMINQQFTYSRSANDGGVAIQILRGATSVFASGSDNTWENQQGSVASYRVGIVGALMYLDSPATTSATTYKTQGRSQRTSLSAQVVFQEASDKTSVITLMEIGA
jgi:hypothetical protein